MFSCNRLCNSVFIFILLSLYFTNRSADFFNYMFRTETCSFVTYLDSDTHMNSPCSTYDITHHSPSLPNSQTWGRLCVSISPTCRACVWACSVCCLWASGAHTGEVVSPGAVRLCSSTGILSSWCLSWWFSMAMVSYCTVVMAIFLQHYSIYTV